MSGDPIQTLSDDPIQTLIDAYRAEHTALCVRLDAQVALGVFDHITAGRCALSDLQFKVRLIEKLEKRRGQPPDASANGVPIAPAEIFVRFSAYTRTAPLSPRTQCHH